MNKRCVALLIPENDPPYTGRKGAVMVRLLVIASLVFFGLAMVCSAQSSSSPSSSSGQQDTSKPPSASPTQAPSQAQAKPTNQPAEGNNKRKPKKVWTNEELGSMKGGVSVVGEQPSTAGGSAASSPSRSLDYSPPSDYEVRVNTYRDRLAPLRANLEEIDRNIQKAKEAKGNASEDTAAWIRVYEGKRSGVLAKMDTILDDARRHGVTPGDLR
jgi:hypothetical protein